MPREDKWDKPGCWDPVYYHVSTENIILTIYALHFSEGFKKFKIYLMRDWFFEEWRRPGFLRIRRPVELFDPKRNCPPELLAIEDRPDMKVDYAVEYRNEVQYYNERYSYPRKEAYGRDFRACLKIKLRSKTDEYYRMKGAWAAGKNVMHCSVDEIEESLSEKTIYNERIRGSVIKLGRRPLTHRAELSDEEFIALVSALNNRGWIVALGFNGDERMTLWKHAEESEPSEANIVVQRFFD